MENIFVETTIILCVASVLALLLRFLKQPSILAYIITGIILGPFAHLRIHDQESFSVMAQLGVTFLLFILGLELQFKELRSLGKTILYASILQIFLTIFLALDIAIIVGFSLISAGYIAIAITFSSTIIIVTLLSGKKDLKSLYGKISVGVLLVQDFFAIFVLMLLSTFSSTTHQALSLNSIVFVFIKAIVVGAGVIYLSKHIFPKVLHMIASSEETLFLCSLAWLFAFTSFVSSPLIGFPIEIGGFLAGVALANSFENFQIIARVRSLRDFFITIFFVILGSQMNIALIGRLLPQMLLLTVFVLFVKPLIVLSILAVMGHRKRTSFFASLNFAQLSEFSLIILFMGERLHHIDASTVSLLTVVSLVTFAISSYMILHANSLYHYLESHLSFFERKHLSDQDLQNSGVSLLSDHIALIGAHRMGETILESLLSEKEHVVVVDFDPDVIFRLRQRGISCVFGDIADSEIQERLQLEKARLIISTVPDVEDNVQLLKSLRKFSKKAKTVIMAQDVHDEMLLYKAGADAVIVPHVIGGKHLAKLIHKEYV